MSADAAYQTYILPEDDSRFAVDEIVPVDPFAGRLVDVEYDWDKVPVPSSLRELESRWYTRRNPLDRSGVWRFRELLPFATDEQIVTIGEGQTLLQRCDEIALDVGLKANGLHLQYEGMNPSGSFKDNGMTAASTHARIVGATSAACASTGNTSASLAIYSSATKLFRCFVFIGSGKIAYGKLSQALDYGAHTIQIEGDFDDALVRVREVCAELGIYLCNSVNPFRLEGQKAIMYRILEELDWEPPDWIVVPGGNLGNSSAFGKAFAELKHLGLVDRVPRLAVINAEGSNTLYDMYEHHGIRWNDGRPPLEDVDSYFETMNAEDRRASTIATAIEINRPVNLLKCLRALETMDGVVREVSDEEILDGKAMVGAHGFGCEPASGATIAGVRRLREEGVIAPSDRVACVLTGHELKDPTATVSYHSSPPNSPDDVLTARGVTRTPLANRPVVVPNDLNRLVEVVRGIG